MPFAKLDTSLRLRFETLPQRQRSDAVALFLSSVLYSAEMLADGRINRAVALTLAHELGQKGVSAQAKTLVDAGFWTPFSASWEIVNWRDFHSSRAEVEERRTYEREKKRRSRSQLSLDVPPPVPLGQNRDVPPVVPSGQLTPTHPRTHTRETAADTEQEQDLQPQQDPAAAAAAVVSPRESTVRTAVGMLRGTDSKSFDRVWPLASTVGYETWNEIIATLEQRIAGGNVTNPVGLLVDLLKTAQRDTLLADRAATEATLANLDSARKRAERLPKDQALEQVIPTVAHHDDQRFETFVQDFLSDVDNDDERRTLEHRAYELREHALSTSAG